MLVNSRVRELSWSTARDEGCAAPTKNALRIAQAKQPREVQRHTPVGGRTLFWKRCLPFWFHTHLGSRVTASYDRYPSLHPPFGHFLDSTKSCRAGNLSLPRITFTKNYLRCLRLDLLRIDQMASQIEFIDHDFEERRGRKRENCSG